MRPVSIAKAAAGSEVLVTSLVTNPVPRRSRAATISWLRRAARRPAAVACDKGYSYPAIRVWLRWYGVRAVIPERRDQAARRAHRPGRKLRLNRAAYRRRAVIECAVGWLKEACGPATRYEKLAIHYLGILHLGIMRKLLKLLLHLSHTA